MCGIPIFLLLIAIGLCIYYRAMYKSYEYTSEVWRKSAESSHDNFMKAIDQRDELAEMINETNISKRKGKHT